MSHGEIDGLFAARVPFPHFANRLPLGVVILDAEKRVLYMNRAAEALTGFEGSAAAGLSCRNVLRTSLCFGDCPVERAFESAGPVSADGDIVNRARRKLPVRVTATALRDGEGNLVGFMETVEDRTDLLRADRDLGEQLGFGEFLGRSRRIREVFDLVPVVAQTDSSVLIMGETGTGKDMMAEVIHDASDRARGPFIKVNCGALPETLLESELFGHTRGAFTGAVEDRPGRIRLAHGGTLYLTEIGDLPLSLQVKLLTFLDDKVVYPLGTAKGFQADVRIIAATHRDLERMVDEGHFRKDLLYRLNVVRLLLPPLRDREEDVGLLLDHFLRLFSERFGKRVVRTSADARKLLESYAYPGNVRELRNIVEYAVNVCPGEVLEPEHLPAYLGEAPAVTSSEQPPAIGRVDPREQVSWGQVERRMIVDALVRTGGRRGRAADMLGWGRSTLWRKMKQHGIDG